MRFVLMLYVLCFCALSARADTVIEHVGANHPGGEGWTLTAGVPGYAYGTEAWRTDTNGYSKWDALGLNASDFAGDWALTVEARWISGPAAQSRCTIFDGLRSKSTALTWDGDHAYYYVGGQGDTAMPGIDPTIFNTYQFIYRDDPGELQVRANGNLIDTLSGSRYNDTAGQYMLYFGDNCGGNFRSTLDWRYVGLGDAPAPGPTAVPGPAMWIVFAGLIGCAAICRLRRRK